jgi:hypothetical protein
VADCHRGATYCILNVAMSSCDKSVNEDFVMSTCACDLLPNAAKVPCFQYKALYYCSKFSY